MEHILQVAFPEGKVCPRQSQLRWILIAGFCIFLTLMLDSQANAFGETKSEKLLENKSAEVKISGYGLLGNRQLKRNLAALEPIKQRPEFLDASFVEDAALLLNARVKRDGFLQPKTSIDMKLDDGTRMKVDASELLEHPLPRPLRVTSVHFRIHKGVLYYFKDLEFSGLKTITEKQARAYFIETGSLFHLKRNRIFTPENLKRGLSSLTDVLDRQGYQDATAEASELCQNDKSGAVMLKIHVRQGSKWMVRSVKEIFFYEGEAMDKESTTLTVNRPFSKIWLQDFSLSLKTNQYRRGYPDTVVQIETLQRHSENGQIDFELLANIRSGPQVRIGKIEFRGQKKTKEHILSRRVRVQSGELLDPILVEEGRYRLAQLGAFETVDLTYKPEDEHTRDVIYHVREGKLLRVNLLFGYGSYELLRGGIELTMYNLWGRAHQLRLKAIQSFKSSSGEFTYTVPEYAGRDVDLFVNGNGLRREELSFTRLEYGGGTGAHKYFRNYSTDVILRYNYQILNAESIVPAVATDGVTNPTVSSIISEIKTDRRDNPLYPRKGYKIFALFELATESLGGDVNYQRIEINPSWHIPVGDGHWFNLGLSHGVDITFGSPARNLPFNRRFFPGGPDSIRGYKEDEASPRNAQGQIVGAETYTLASAEFEQSLTPKWTIVIFSDSIGFARRIENYPFDTALFSVGAGLRWRTLIGPVRLEYGHNLNPRPRDPAGTLQISLGFPF